MHKIQKKKVIAFNSSSIDNQFKKKEDSVSIFKFSTKLKNINIGKTNYISCDSSDKSTIDSFSFKNEKEDLNSNLAKVVINISDDNKEIHEISSTKSNSSDNLFKNEEDSFNKDFFDLSLSEKHSTFITFNSINVPKLPHYCYLLKSLKENCTNRSYIGYTTDPRRRLRQHNRELLSGGAKKTLLYCPWQMEIIVSGFQNKCLLSS